MSRINQLLQELIAIEEKLKNEIQKSNKEYFYSIIRKKVQFARDVRKKHKKLAKGLIRYFLDANPLYFLTIPVIFALFIPALILDFSVTIYQYTCFWIYKIPRVNRSEYVIIDRQYLAYLNIFQKLNCVYCGYFNGVMAYVSEVAGRTEQHFCPIKHARKLKSLHSRYDRFLDYGDGENFEKDLLKVKIDYSDLKK